MKRGLVYVGLLVALFVVGCQPQTAQQTNFDQVQWSCVEYQCAEFGSGIAWAEQNCEDTDNGTLCPVVVEGQQYLVPIQELNLSAIQTCEQYSCVAEAPTRAVNYSVNESEVLQNVQG